MTEDDIIRMAKKAGFELDCCSLEWHDRIERFFHMAQAAEREACAKLADEQLMNTSDLMSMPPKSSAAWNIAAAIRARGQA